MGSNERLDARRLPRAGRRSGSPGSWHLSWLPQQQISWKLAVGGWRFLLQTPVEVRDRVRDDLLLRRVGVVDTLRVARDEDEPVFLVLYCFHSAGFPASFINS